MFRQESTKFLFKGIYLQNELDILQKLIGHLQMTDKTMALNTSAAAAVFFVKSRLHGTFPGFQLQILAHLPKPLQRLLQHLQHLMLPGDQGLALTWLPAYLNP